MQVHTLGKKGLVWDPPIHADNEGAFFGWMVEEVGPLSHPWSYMVPRGNPYTVGLEG